MYLGLSFACDPSILYDAPKEIHYPEVDAEDLKEIEAAFFTAGQQEGSTIIKLGKDVGTICLQFFLIPTKTDYKKMVIYPEIYRKIQKDFDLREGEETSIFYAAVPHEYQGDYVLGISAFMYDRKIDSPLFFIGAADRSGFYSKIDELKIKKS
jgi:hypothetical protein